MGHRRGRKSAVLFVTALLVVGPLQAQTQTWKESYRQVVPSSNIEGLSAQGAFGEQVSLYTGALSFRATDVSLPGNDGLEVAFHRKLELDDPRQVRNWRLEVPYLEGVYPSGVGWTREALGGTPVGRCSSGKLAPPLATGGSVGTGATTSSWDASEYWNGDFLNLPGKGPEELLKTIAGGAKLPTDGMTYVWLTQSGWRFSCLSSLQNGSGEGFLGISPQGVRYTFDRLSTEPEEQLSRPGGTAPLLQAASAARVQAFEPVGYSDFISRVKVRLYVSRVEDRFGNYVTYSYGANGLTSIIASDGRTITINRDVDGDLVSVTANGRSWTYTGNSGVFTVTRPDGSQWHYDLNALQTQFNYAEGADGSLSSLDKQCDAPPAPIGAGTAHYSGTVTAPSGAVGMFTVTVIRHGRSDVPRNCPGFLTQAGTYYAYAYRPYVFDTRAVTSIQVTGPGLAPATWSYAYGPANNSWEADCASGCVATKYVDVTVPDGTRTRHTFSNRFGLLEGRELTTQVYAAGGALARTTTYTYQTNASGQPYPAEIGWEGNQRGDGVATRFEPELSTTIVQDGRTFPRQVTAYDDLARPVALTRGGRAEAIVYSDNLSKWVLGQVAQRTVAGVIAEQTTFTTNAQPWKLYSFGKLQQTLTYNTDGTLQTVTDGNSHTTTLSQWYRGIPKRIDHADGKYQAALVDANGWLTQVADENGHATVYNHDAMGRLSGITYPTGDSTVWNTTTIAFAPVASIEYGIPSSHWRQTVSTGNARKVTWFDGLWRALLTREYDAGNIAATDHYSAASYDSLGRPAYTAYPVASAPTSSAGTWTLPGVRTTYDALGRVLTVNQDSEIGTLTTSSQYLSDFRTKVINPRGNANTTSYLTWDVPTTDYPVTIIHPEGAQTDIARDAFGKPLSITRGEQ